MASTPDQGDLRETVGMLGTLLGEVLEELEGKALFAHVELARLTARARRDAEPGAERRFTRLLHDMSPDEALAVTRAFSSFFGLINLAERLDRHQRRQRAAALDQPPPGSFLAVLRGLRAAAVDRLTLDSVLQQTLVNPVFTAHPTEAVRSTLLRKEQRMARALLERAASGDPAARARCLDRIRDEVGIAWQTDEQAAAPSVAEEVEHLLFYLANVIYPSVPAVFEALEDAIARVYGPGTGLPEAARLLRFGSWVGGDMDGNPSVGPDTIEHTLARQRTVVLERYRGDVRALFDSLSQGGARVRPLPALAARLDEYRERFATALQALPSRYTEMPYRVFLWAVWERLRATAAQGDGAYASAAAFLDDLELLHASLREHGGTGARQVLALQRRVRVFGLHMAALDVRQDSAVHQAAVAEALGDPGFAERATDARLARLADALATAAPFAGTPLAGGALAQTLAVMTTLRDARARHGQDALGLYIISMARGADDALAVLYLARLAGLVDEHGGVPLDIAPLFETVDDLHCAPEALAQMLDAGAYQAHLQGRARRQFVMLGYSDSNKESGIVASRWALHEAQIALVEVIAASARTAPAGDGGRAGLELTLFHGRGGTISRGGSEPREGILAEPPGALAGRLRVTEQGEIIGQKYGLVPVAEQTLETALGTLLERHLLDAGSPADQQRWQAVARSMAADSRALYRNLVLEDADLVAYFRAATPIDVIERLRIGSRPASRQRGDGGVGSLRAIPWVFAWTQSRHILPGWYGLGSALSGALASHGLPELRAMARDWRFFATLLSDVEMVLAKADMGIASLYAALAGAAGERVYPRLLSEFETTSALLCEVLEQDALLARKPDLRRAIALRNPYVDPISLVQVDCLQRWRAGGREDAALQRVLVETVRGIARGMQNTG